MRKAQPDRLGRLARGYAAVIVRLRWLVVAAWIGGVVWATLALPLPGAGDNLGNLVPPHSAAFAAEQRSLQQFSLPVVTGTIVVVHNPAGLSTLSEADVVLHALAIDVRLLQLQPPYPANRVLGALPIVKPLNRTTAVTYLYFAPNTAVSTQLALARRYADHFRADVGARTYVTGLVPAELAQTHYLMSSLTLVEITTLALVALIVAFVFRSVLAPLLTLGAAALAFLVDDRLLGWLQTQGIGLPSQLEPLVVALLLGVLTDYSVFFLSGYRGRLAAGDTPLRGSRMAIAQNGPIVVVAGCCAAAGCAALYAAPLKLYRSFGPGLALTVVVGAAAAVTLVPAAMAILGRRVFWPSHPNWLAAREERPLGRRASWLARLVSHRLGAAVAALICFVLIGFASLPLMGLRLSLSFIEPLPSSTEVQRGVAVLAKSYARGITAPTELLIEGRRLSNQEPSLVRLQRAVAAQPGVADVIGPEDDPLPKVGRVLVSADQRTARLIVVFDSDPLGGQAVSDLRALESAAPRLAHDAGLRGVTLSYAGDTALASEVSRLTLKNLVIILGAAFGAELLILALYLRALVAPVYLLICSALTVAAALGLTVLVFQVGMGASGLTFYAPFASAVLLLALGSDYNVFGIGRIWEEAGHRSLSEAIRGVLPRTARAISTAGITLAGSFALVALVPLLTFAELAFTMAVGLLIDTFVVRSVLTPSLLTLVGTASGWPGRRLRRPAQADAAAGDAGGAGIDAGAAIPTDAPLPTAPPGGPAVSAERPVGATAAQLAVGRPPARRAPRRLSPGRAALRLLVVAVVLALAGWGLDWAARIGAESLIARSIQRAEHLSERPSVKVRGWFFLPQVVAGNYGEVDVTVANVRDGPLRLSRVTAHLYGAHVPLHDVVTAGVSAVPVDRTHETAKLTYTDLDKYLAAQGQRMTVAAGPTGQVKITAHTTVLGKALAVSADAKVGSVPGYLKIVPTQLDTDVKSLDNASKLLLGQRLTIEIPTAALPFGQQVTAIHPGPSALVIDAAGRDVVLGRSGSG